MTLLKMESFIKIKINNYFILFQIFNKKFKKKMNKMYKPS